MKKILTTLLGLLALAAFVTTTQAAANPKTAAEFDTALTKLEKFGIISAADSAHFKQAAEAGKKATCDTDKVLSAIQGVIKKLGGNATTLDEIIAYMADKKLVGKPETWRQPLSSKTIDIARARSLLISLSKRIK